MKNENNFEGLPRTPDGALYDLPPNTLCADGCGTIVSEEDFVRVGADKFYIPGHELNSHKDYPRMITMAPRSINNYK